MHALLLLLLVGLRWLCYIVPLLLFRTCFLLILFVLFCRYFNFFQRSAPFSKPLLRLGVAVVPISAAEPRARIYSVARWRVCMLAIHISSRTRAHSCAQTPIYLGRQTHIYICELCIIMGCRFVALFPDSWLQWCILESN